MHIYNKSVFNCLILSRFIVVLGGRSGGTLEIEEGQTVVLTCKRDVVASSKQLPVSVETFEGIDLEPGISVFIGQYLFTGSETTSAYLTVTKVLTNEVLCLLKLYIFRFMMLTLFLV